MVLLLEPFDLTIAEIVFTGNEDFRTSVTVGKLVASFITLVAKVAFYEYFFAIIFKVIFSLVF